MSRPTRGPLSRFPVRGCHPLWPAFPDASGTKDNGHWPVPRSLATTDGISRQRLSPPPSRAACAARVLMSVPPATEMFQFTGFASCTYEFSTGYPCGWVAPFGDPGITDRSHLPRAFRSVPRPSSPLSAKASTRCPCFALDHRIAVTGDAAPPPRTGPNPSANVPSPQQRGAAVSMKTLLSDKPQSQALLAPPSGASEAGAMPTGQPSSASPGPVRLGHITTLSSPFNQPRRGRPRRCRSIFSERRARPGAADRQHLSVQPGCTCRRQNSSFGKAVLWLVEVNGFEPMTSCLQSRRSPS